MYYLRPKYMTFLRKVIYGMGWKISEWRREEEWGQLGGKIWLVSEEVWVN